MQNEEQLNTTFTTSNQVGAEPIIEQEAQQETLILGKYKTQADLEKGYKELAKKNTELTGKIKNATVEPKTAEPQPNQTDSTEIDYAFDFSTNEILKDFDVSSVDELPAMVEVFKSIGLDNNKASAIVEKFLEMEIDNFNKDFAAEKEKLGANWEKEAPLISNFLGKFNEEYQEALGLLTCKASGIKFIKEVLMKTERSIPAKVEIGADDVSVHTQAVTDFVRSRGGLVSKLTTADYETFSKLKSRETKALMGF